MGSDVMRCLGALALLLLPSCTHFLYRELDREDFEHGGAVLAKGGVWEVIPSSQAPSPEHVLQQGAPGMEGQMQLAICAARAPVAGQVKVWLRPVDGGLHQGGGLAWYVRDERNYECAGWDPLQQCLRVYAIADGSRSLLGQVHVQTSTGWHFLCVRFDWAKVQVFLDGAQRLAIERPHSGPPGFIGLWTEADARTQFDDLKVGSIDGHGIGW